MSQPSRTIRHLRGAIVGAVCAITGISAHAGAAGVLPAPDALAVTAAACAGLGAAVAARPTRLATPLILIVWLAAGQGLAHVLLLVLADHAAGHPQLLSPAMLVLHTIATLATAAALIVVEPALVTLLTAVVRMLRAVLAPPDPATFATRPGRALTRDVRPILRAIAPLDARGPPPRAA
ncbi:hypothetical protein QSJ18_16510 [Gordonia sp. ABSL1-1]|uniref:hypothetical protein n=1 Tax=Gordonia sp. ABSL1-1 TaxID=3053923 RepID=UPI002573F535|nr:hypothetical protein [Gordonia sp. ABSL1-1]MDL9938355.1 hypothetical protein [Gordonia sp. ABSL1-1]